ncbi:MAG TPA: polysaccharide pyruvyl transferase family protein [Spirochaetota bacterium]|nr:polysaccharide pyruvyl transferase family protein [Spirochaetota bacterium]
MTQKRTILLTGASLSSGNKGINALTLGTIISLYNNNNDIEVEILNQNSRIDDEVIHEIKNGDRAIQVKENYVWSSKFILCGLLHLTFPFLPNRIKEILFIKCLKISYLPHVILKRKSVNFKEPALKKLISADLVINLSEGDSFSDIYGMHVFLRQSLDKVIAHSHGVPYYFFPQTLGPFNSNPASKLAGKIFKSAGKIYARESQTRDYLINMFGELPNMEEANDMAFLMEPEPVEDPEFEKFCSDGIITGINISGFLNSNPIGDRILSDADDYNHITDRILNTLLSLDEKVKIVFVSHVSTEDDKANRAFMEKYKKSGFGDRLFLLNHQYSAPQLKYFISRMDLFTGARMHACIGALSTGVATVPQAYSYKFVGITDKFGIGEYVIDLKKDTKDIAEEKLKSVFNNREIIKRKLISSLPEIKKDADKCGKNI